MATLSHDASDAEPERQSRISRLAVSETWVSLAIGVIWLAVLLDALFGPDIVVSNAGGTTTIPSAVVVVVFAYLATRVVAKHGFGRGRDGTR